MYSQIYLIRTLKGPDSVVLIKWTEIYALETKFLYLLERFPTQRDVLN